MTDKTNITTLESRMADGDPLAFRDVIDSYFESYSEEEAVRKTIEQADTNPWAAVQVAQWCENNSYPDMLKQEDRLSFLKKAVNCPRGAVAEQAVINWLLGAMPGLYEDIDACIWTDPVGRAWYALGNYYLQFDDEKSLNEAYYFLTYAGKSGSKVREQLKIYRYKIRSLHKSPNTDYELYPEDRKQEEEQIKNEWEHSDDYRCSKELDEKLAIALENKIYQEEYARRQFQTLSESLKCDFGDSIWENATEETKIYLKTGFYCFEQLKMLNSGFLKIDFSVAINPVVRALEQELSLRFYSQYILYLREHYPNPEDYFSINDIAPRDIKNRKAIVSSWEQNNYSYNKPNQENGFTLASLSFIVGCGWKTDGKDVKIDKTMLDYCSNALLSKKDFCKLRGCAVTTDADYEKNISWWLLELCRAVQEVKDIRNKASHGGQVCSNIDCQFCYDSILLVKKILIQVLEVCNKKPED